MQRMTYREAAQYLGKKEDTIKHAVTRGVLTLLPRKGAKVYLSKEQIDLFKNKRLSKDALTEEELQLWERYASDSLAQAVNNTNQVAIGQHNRVQEVISAYNELTPESKEKMALIGVAVTMLGGLALSPLAVGSLLMGISVGGLIALLRAKLELPKNATEHDIDKVVTSVPDVKEREQVKRIILDTIAKV